MRNSLLCALACVLCLVACASTQPAKPERVEVGHLHNVMRINDWLWSGAQPVGDDFQTLADAGVKTIISVDGAVPDVAAAKAAGIRYVHIPIGYDAIPEAARAQLARATAECERPIYVHCHHGKHRGPAAAAVIYRCDTACTADEAAEIMRIAGTGAEYAGLWRDVEEFDPATTPSKAALVESADIPDFAARMAEIDRAWDRFQPDEATADQLEADALIIEEGLRECLRFLDEAADTDLRTRLEASLGSATRMREGARGETTRLLELRLEVGNDCKGCHKAHRN